MKGGTAGSLPYRLFIFEVYVIVISAVQYNFFPYIYFLMISAGITFFLAVFSISRLRVTGQTVFSLWMLICSYWSVCNAFELMGTALSVKLFWANMQYAAYSLFPVCLFILTTQLTGVWQEVKLRGVAVLLIIPVITTVLVWFDRPLGLVRYDFSLGTTETFSFIKKQYGPWFRIHAMYMYGLFLWSFMILARSINTQKNRLYKKQQELLLLSISVLFVPNVLFVVGISPVRTIDVTPVFFSVTGSLVLWSMFRYRFMDLVPAARVTVFDNMGEGIIVTDDSGMILDINKRARAMFALSGLTVTGRQLTEAVPCLFISQEGAHDGASAMFLCSIPGGSADGRWLERRCAPLSSRHGDKMAGWIYSVSDVTEFHDANRKVVQQQQELAVSAEQQRVARDLHDNIGQILSFAGIQIQTIQRELNRGHTDLAEEYLSRLKQAVDQSYAELRAYIFNLRQPGMQNVPFKEMISDFADHVCKTFHVECILQLPEQIPEFFDSTEIKSHLFSLTKEAVNNSFKHAAASQITIGIHVIGNDSVIYFIEDNGKGIVQRINPEDTASGTKHSSGMRIMEERALLTGGRLHIISAPGCGTRIEVVYDGGKNDHTCSR